MFEEIQHEADAGGGLVGDEDVASFGYEFEAGAGDAVGDGAAVFGGDEAVFLTVDDEGRDLDAGEAAVGTPNENAAELADEATVSPVALGANAEILFDEFNGRGGRIEQRYQCSFARFAAFLAQGNTARRGRKIWPTGDDSAVAGTPE